MVKGYRLFSVSLAIAAMQTVYSAAFCAAHAQMYYNQQESPGGFAGRARDANFSNGFTQSYGAPPQQSYSQPVQQTYAPPTNASLNTAASLENMLNRVDPSSNWAPSQPQQYQQQQYQAPQQNQQRPQQFAMQQQNYQSQVPKFHSYMNSQPQVYSHANQMLAQRLERSGGSPFMNTCQRMFPGVSRQEIMRVFMEGGMPQTSFGGGPSPPSGQSNGNNAEARSTAYSNYQTAANEETKSRNWANTAHYDKDKWNRKNAADRAYYAANNANYAAQRAESAANSSGDSQARGYANSARACANRARYNANQARYNADTIQ